MIQSLQQVLSTTWSAVGAAVSVILVLLYGYGGRKIKLVTQAGEDNMSKLSVTIFLPCLLFSEIGPLASWSNIKEYWIIIVYSLLFQLCSYAFGLAAVYGLKMPQWIIPCMVFNNATSLPLLLLQSLGKSGTLSPLLLKGDTIDAVLSRGKVYMLINALICNLTRFTFGPYMMTSHSGTWTHSESPHSIVEKLDAALPSATSRPAQATPTAYPAVEPYPDVHESSPLIRKTAEEARQGWRLAKVAQKAVSGFMNPPMIGGLAAIIAGVIPFLHKWLFAENAWLSPFSQSIENLGALYAVLQTFVLGAHLKSKKGSKPPLWPLLYLFTYRFFIMPLISISVVYSTRKWLGGKILLDPVLDFVMAISAVGPPALTLAAIVEMSDADESTHTAVAQTIVISYVLTPLISVSVTAALTMIGKLYD